MKAKYTNVSQFSGREHTMTFDMSQEEFNRRLANWMNGQYIQVAFDNLNADEREFIMTGVTTEEWNDVFKDE